MSQAKPRTEAQRKAYLQRVLKMNPLSDSEHVMALRNRFHRVPAEEQKRSTGPADSVYEQREIATAAIANVRQNFWKTDLEKIQGALKPLLVEEYPDLKNAVQRLSVLADNRHSFARLAANNKFNRGFLNELKEILVLSQKEAAELKDALQQKMSVRARAKHVRRSLKILEKEAPDVYDLEYEWFELLKTIKPYQAPRATQMQQSESGSDGGGWGWAAWIGIVIVLKILGALARG